MGVDLRAQQLLALCTVKSLNWNLIAREASRPDGLELLLEGKTTERSPEAKDARALIRTVKDWQARNDQALQEIERAIDAGAKLTTVLDADYPSNLRLIYNLPPFLFYRGSLQIDDARSVAVVGTRDATEIGLKRARQMARLLARSGVTVLSGLARGIDTAAHEATLKELGRTIAVVGTGILMTYPRENGPLAERIAETGAVVSQFWPSAPPATYSFPRRNVVMSGMGQGTIVIEATKTSGAKMQARLAADHGKLVFLLKSLVTDQPWAQKMIEKRRAVEIDGVDDVIKRLLSPEQIDALSAQRQQLALDFA